MKLRNDYTFVGKGRVSLYPWREWLDGQIREAVQGVDFKVTPKSFRATLITAAARQGLAVRTRLTEKSVIFQSYKRES